MSLLASLPIIGQIVGGPIQSIIDKMGEKDRREFEMAMQAIDAEYQLKIEQIKINQAEASHSSVFVAGWRPFLGWACGGIFIASALAALVAVFHPVPAEGLEALDKVKDMMMPLLLGMLGLGGMRSFEKMKGVARNKLSG